MDARRSVRPFTRAASITALALVALAAWGPPRPAAASTLEPEPFLYGLESAAFGEGPATLFFNPAVAGLRYPADVALSLRDPDGGDNVWRGTMAKEGFTFGVTAGKNRRTGFDSGFAGGRPSFRVGGSFARIPKPGGGRYSDYRVGVISRPQPWLSLGGVLEHPFEPDESGVEQERRYTVGVALRPLAMMKSDAAKRGTRFTLAADALFKGDDTEDAELRFTAEVEPVPGIVLRGAYLAEDKSFKVGVSLLGVTSAYYGHRSWDGDQNVVATTHTVSFHKGEDHTILAPPAKRRVAVVPVGGELADESLSGFSIYGSTRTTAVAPIHQQLERALEDPLTRGVLLDLRGPSNMAQIEELRPRIARLRAAGKPVVAYLEHGGGRASFYLASACDRVVATPEAFYPGLGLRAERRYYRKLLEDWGIRLDRSSFGEYKSAYRNYSVDSTTGPDREALEHTLDQAQELFVSTVAADRKIDRARLMGVLDGRRWSSRELAKAGLVDSVGYREDAIATAGQLAGLGRRPATARLASRPAAKREWTTPTGVAIVYLSGGIETGRSGSDLLMGPYMGAETASRQVEQAFRDPGARAVVLRIESPGGSSLASDLIHHAIARAKRDHKKPLVVSMGGAAASGGYQIALPGDKIFADRFTRTGSIGVVYVKPSFEGWYAKHGVRQDDFERGPYMRGWSMARDWDAEIQASADSAIQSEYRDFVGQVADARKLPWETVDEAARGRVWLGQDALERKLVDGIGGLDDAIAEARRLARIPEGQKIAPAEYRRPRPNLVERLVGSMVRETVERNVHLPEPGTVLHWMDEGPLR